MTVVGSGSSAVAFLAALSWCVWAESILALVWGKAATMMILGGLRQSTLTHRGSWPISNGNHCLWKRIGSLWMPFCYALGLLFVMEKPCLVPPGCQLPGHCYETIGGFSWVHSSTTSCAYVSFVRMFLFLAYSTSFECTGRRDVDLGLGSIS